MASQGPGWSSYKSERRQMKKATPFDKLLIVLFIAALGYVGGFLIGMRFSAGPRTQRISERQLTMEEQNRRASGRVQVMAISCALFAGMVGAVWLRQANKNDGVVDLSDMDRH